MFIHHIGKIHPSFCNFRHYNDGLSDDEEYQNMTEAERNERFKPKSFIFKEEKDSCPKEEASTCDNDPTDIRMNKDINVDGMPLDLSSSSDDGSSENEQVSTTTTTIVQNGRKRMRRGLTSSDEECGSKNAKQSCNTNNIVKYNELPDIEVSGGSVLLERQASSEKDNETGGEGACPKKPKNRNNISTLGKV